MFTDQNRRIPVKAFRRVTGRRLWLDVDRFAGWQIDSRDIALLPLRIEQIGVARHSGRLMPISAEDHSPIRGTDAVNVVCPRRTSLGIVVLSTAINIVKRLGIVERELVVLRDRKVFHVTPGFTQIEAFVYPAVGSHHDVVGVGRMENDGMHVAVLIRMRHGRERFASILRFLNRRTHQIETIKLMRARVNLLVVMRSCAASHRVGTLHPTRAAVLRPPYAARAPLQLYRRIDYIGVLHRDGQPDFAHITLRQAGLQLSPTRAAVGGAVNTGFRATPHVGGDSAMVLPGCGV